MLEKRKYMVNVIDNRTGRLMEAGHPLSWETDSLVLFVDTPELELNGEEKGITVQHLGVIPAWRNKEHCRELADELFMLIYALMPDSTEGKIQCMAALASGMTVLFEKLVGAKKAAEMFIHMAECAAEDALKEMESTAEEPADIDPEFFNTGETEGTEE